MRLARRRACAGTQELQNQSLRRTSSRVIGALVHRRARASFVLLFSLHSFARAPRLRRRSHASPRSVNRSLAKRSTFWLVTPAIEIRRAVRRHVDVMQDDVQFIHLFARHTAEAKHTDLFGDVLPRERRTGLFEVFSQHRADAGMRSRRGPCAPRTTARELGVAENGGRDERPVKRRVGVHGARDHFELRFHANRLRLVVARMLTAPTQLTVQAHVFGGSIGATPPCAHPRQSARIACASNSQSPDANPWYAMSKNAKCPWTS